MGHGGVFLLSLAVFSLGLNFIFLYMYSNFPYGFNYNQSYQDLERICCEARKRRAGTRYICPFYQGGLGNHMFQVASVYGIAKIRGFQVGMTRESKLYDYFALPLPELKEGEENTCREAKDIPQIRACAYDRRTVEFEDDCSSDYHIEAYVQSWKYFKHVEEDIRKFFTFKKKIITEAEDLLRRTVFGNKKSSLRDDIIVGVHVRRGDFLTPNNTHYGYNVADKAFIDKALNHYRNLLKTPKFIIFVRNNTEDNSWCRKNIIGKDVYFANNSSPGVDLCALSLCNHTVMTVGSFGWWGSWLSRGTTVYFKNVAKNGSELELMFSKNKSDYFYPSWVGM